MKFIVSTTTIPSRKDMFLQVVNLILKQTFKFDKYCINIDDNLTEDDYNFYANLTKLDSRIEINKCDAKWRSANKLLPTIKKYPNDVIITVDDDLSYDENCLQELVTVWENNKDCIVCHEINPAVLTKTHELRYVNTLDVKLYQKEFGKYLSHSCLFPPHVFDNTDVFDYDKMMKLTNGTHDELWFWEQTTLKGIYVIGLDWTMSLGIDSALHHNNADYQLTNINAIQFNIDNYNYKFNAEYGDKIFNAIKNKPIIFNVSRSNLQAIVGNLNNIKQLYEGFPVIEFICDSTMKKSHIWYLQTRLLINKFSLDSTKIIF